MPLVSSSYEPPVFFRYGHFSTVYSGLVRKIDGVEQKRDRLILTDGDFLDLDWSFASKATKKIAIIIHGLEGSAQRAYIKGSSKVLIADGYDVCAINLRGCSGVPNKLYKSYHSGATEDLDAVVQHILQQQKYSQIFLHGYSLGGNLLLKYLGEDRLLPTEIVGAVAVSVPCQLADSLQQLMKFKNVIYAERFRGNLVGKLKIKQQQFPDKISTQDIKQVKTLKDFDDIYTSRAHGFKDAMDYYRQCSCLQFLPNVKIPSLIINAQNDSFLGEACYPIKEAEHNKNLFLETPQYGGHVGFYGPDNITYTESRTVQFFNTIN